MQRLIKALDLVEAISEQADVASVSGELEQLATDYGFNTFVLAAFTGPGTLDTPYLLASGWDPEWQQRYEDNQYGVDDPVVARAARSSRPFVWNDTLNDPWVTPMGARIMDEACEFNMKDGILVPVHGPNGCEGALAFGGDQADLSSTDMKALHLVGLYAFSHLMDLETGRQDPPLPEQILTDRELDCLRWAAAGKTSWEISSVLGISRHTTDWYLAEATRKLGAANRTHAVVQAMRKGLIA